MGAYLKASYPKGKVYREYRDGATFHIIHPEDFDNRPISQMVAECKNHLSYAELKEAIREDQVLSLTNRLDESFMRRRRKGFHQSRSKPASADGGASGDPMLDS